jgi:hypothetical protein
MTLLELLLSLALLAIVVTLLGTAIHLHLRVLDIRRTDIEQAQLARAVLRMIADDLRSTIQSDPVDFSSVADLAAAYDTEMPDVEDLEDQLAEAGLDETEASPTEGIADSLTPPSEPGLYGNCCELLIDVSRLPRPDEYALVAAAAAGAPVDIPSEIKSVAYYLVDGSSSDGFGSGQLDESINTGVDTSAFGGQARGLVRRELSRAVTEWAVENGNLDTLRRNARIVAPEVVGLEFRYFDGTEWFFEWDTQLEGGLPIAVEIAIWVQSPDAATKQEDRADRRLTEPFENESLETESPNPPGSRVYRLLVDLPAGRPTTDEDAAEAAEDALGAPPSVMEDQP